MTHAQNNGADMIHWRGGTFGLEKIAMDKETVKRLVKWFGDRVT